MMSRLQEAASRRHRRRLDDGRERVLQRRHHRGIRGEHGAREEVCGCRRRGRHDQQRCGCSCRGRLCFDDIQLQLLLVLRLQGAVAAVLLHGTSTAVRLLLMRRRRRGSFYERHKSIVFAARTNDVGGGDGRGKKTGPRFISRRRRERERGTGVQVLLRKRREGSISDENGSD